MPWLNISVDPDGSIKPCCESQYYVRKDNGTKFNLGTDTIEDIYNSTDFVNIRTSMLEGKQVSGCETCYKNEEISGHSSRTYRNEHWKTEFTKPIAETKIQYFDLRFGNLCNLMCRSCNPRNSSQLEKELKTLSHINISTYISPGYDYDINEWYLTDTFDKNMESQINNIKWLYITGGEPTIVEKNIQLLEKLISSGRSKSIILSFNTNMTNTKPKFYELIKEFRNVICIASIDGYGDMQEYLRYPSDWNKINSNLQELVDMGRPVKVLPTVVVQATNLGKLVELFDYFENFNRIANKRLLEIEVILLQYPSYLNLVHLPVTYKIKCWEQIEEWLQTMCKYQSSHFHTSMVGLKELCYADALSIPEIKKYKEFNSLLDTNRKQKLQDVNLELYNIIKNI
jgi:MoaA/NifB/PqqE/SkfB family radical SAM enzyme